MPSAVPSALTIPAGFFLVAFPPVIFAVKLGLQGPFLSFRSGIYIPRLQPFGPRSLFNLPRIFYLDLLPAPTPRLSPFRPLPLRSHPYSTWYDDMNTTTPSPTPGPAIKRSPSLQSPSNSAAGTKRKRTTAAKFYAVKVGYQPGVYNEWNRCLKQVTGFKGAVCKFISTSS